MVESCKKSCKFVPISKESSTKINIITLANNCQHYLEKEM